MQPKRKVSTLVPYLVRENDILVYLQKRDKDAKRLPDYFGFFGGGSENDENPQQTLLREIKEELNFIPEGFSHFKQYEFESSIRDIFILEVDDNFENKIQVLEGQYGRWFREGEVINEQKLSDSDRLALRDIFNFLRLNVKSQ